jgi:hypothetical protein
MSTDLLAGGTATIRSDCCFGRINSREDQDSICCEVARTRREHSSNESMGKRVSVKESAKRTGVIETMMLIVVALRQEFNQSSHQLVRNCNE